MGNSNGDVAAALAGAARKVEAVYCYPYQNHATMEPMNATARWTPERCEVWTPTQNGEAALAAAAEAAGLPLEQVRRPQDAPRRRLRPARLHRLRAPGGARSPRQMPGTPVKLIWIARGGHAARPLPPGHAVQAARRPGRAGQPDRRCTCASPASRSWPACSRRTCDDGRDPVVFQGLNPAAARRRSATRSRTC